MAAIGYFYDDNFRLAGTMPLQPNPKKPLEFLVPSNCTTVEPPTGYTALEVPQFNQDANEWALIKSPYFYELQEVYSEARTVFGVPLYEQDSEGVWIERNQAEVDAEVAAFQAQADYDKAVSDAKELMDQNIINKALEITSASSLESAQAFMSAYQVRAFNPAGYVAAGLIVRYELAGYTLGQALDTEALIKSYYTDILVYIDLFREAEINNYISTIGALTPPI